VTHVYNLSYSGSREQEDQGFKPAQANSSQDPILKKNKTPSQKNKAKLYCRRNASLFSSNTKEKKLRKAARVAQVEHQPSKP
jgi:hypothetical protein